MRVKRDKMSSEYICKLYRNQIKEKHLSSSHSSMSYDSYHRCVKLDEVYGSSLISTVSIVWLEVANANNISSLSCSRNRSSPLLAASFIYTVLHCREGLQFPLRLYLHLLRTTQRIGSTQTTPLLLYGSFTCLN